MNCTYCKRPMRPKGTNLRDYPNTVATRRITPPTCSTCGKLEDNMLKTRIKKAVEAARSEAHEELLDIFRQEARKRIPAERIRWFIDDALKTCNPDDDPRNSSGYYKLRYALATLRQIKQILKKEQAK